MTFFETVVVANLIWLNLIVIYYTIKQNKDGGIN